MMNFGRGIMEKRIISYQLFFLESTLGQEFSKENSAASRSSAPDAINDTHSSGSS